VSAGEISGVLETTRSQPDRAAAAKVISKMRNKLTATSRNDHATVIIP
jgi:hypothetical protein